jgi:hypothetical protein
VLEVLTTKAASSGDRRAFKDQFAGWASSSPLGEHRIGIYLLGAVKYMVRVFVLGNPSGALLNQLGADVPEIHERVAQWWKVNARAIHDAGVQDK